MSNYIVNLLHLKDQNIKIDENSEFTEEMKVNGATYVVVPATLTYTPCACEKCGAVNDSHQVVKHGFHKPSFIKIGRITDRFAYLKLRKQRFLCRECGETFIASSPLVEKHCFISNPLKGMILGMAGNTQAMKTIAYECAVSVSTVIRGIDNASQSFLKNPHSLPEQLSFDECKFTEKDLSFICIDAKSHEFVDILPSRKQSDLLSYFQRYDLSAREKVTAVVMDMYKPYELLVPQLFPNAVVVTDRFHIVQHLNVGLNRIRIEVMNKLRYTQPRDYKKLKDLWKLILMNREELDFDKYFYHPLFDGLVTQKMMVDYMINLSPRLLQAYEIINHLKFSVHEMDAESFFEDLLASRTITLRRYVRQTLQTFKRREKSVRAAMDNAISNGPIEGINNKIKTIKRTGYGYRNFERLRIRVLLCAQIDRAKRLEEERQKAARKLKREQKKQLIA